MQSTLSSLLTAQYIPWFLSLLLLCHLSHLPLQCIIPSQCIQVFHTFTHDIFPACTVVLSPLIFSKSFVVLGVFLRPHLLECFLLPLIWTLYLCLLWFYSETKMTEMQKSILIFFFFFLMFRVFKKPVCILEAWLVCYFWCWSWTELQKPRYVVSTALTTVL